MTEQNNGTSFADTSRALDVRKSDRAGLVRVALIPWVLIKLPTLAIWRALPKTFSRPTRDSILITAVSYSVGLPITVLGAVLGFAFYPHTHMPDPEDAFLIFFTAMGDFAKYIWRQTNNQNEESND